MSRSRSISRRAGFTLVELLVVIGIIAVLISILLPALQRARDSSATIKCAANLRSVGAGLLAYAAENKQYLPVSYNYRNTNINLTTGIQLPTAAAYGYIHWTSLIYGNTPTDAFQCPAVQNGGLPATDPQPGNFDSGQICDTGDTSGGAANNVADPSGRVTGVTAIDGTGASVTYYPDSMAARCSYTLNEGVCGRNKYVVGFQGGTRVYRNVNLSQVDAQSGTILASEFVDEWGIVSGVNRGGGSGVVCKSHRPTCPWRATGTAVGDTAQVDPSVMATSISLRRTVATDLWNGVTSGDIIKDYQAGTYTAATRGTRLDWIGRNHGYGEKPADKKSNFLYCDGHVETKTILETLPATTATNSPWEWGSADFSTQPANLAVGQ